MNKNEPPEMAQELIRFALIQVIIATLAILASRILLPTAREETQQLVSGVLIIVVAFVWILYLQNRGRLRTAILIVPLFLLAAVYLFGTLAEQRTIYFVVDASDNMQNSFEQIRLIELEALRFQSNDDFDFGLAVYGGRISGETGCNDVAELVSPSSQDVSIPRISQAVAALTGGAIEPQGEGLLQEAIMYSIGQLTGRRGIHQLFVITSGPDSRCANLNREMIQDMADQQGVKLELIVIVVGEISGEDELTILTFADRYRNVGTVIEIEAIIEEVIRTAPSPYGLYSPYSP